MLQQRFGFCIRLSVGADNDIHAQHINNRVEVDFWKHDVLFQAHGIVATTIELRTFHAAEVTDTRQGDGGQTIH